MNERTNVASSPEFHLPFRSARWLDISLLSHGDLPLCLSAITVDWRCPLVLDLPGSLSMQKLAARHTVHLLTTLQPILIPFRTEIRSTQVLVSRPGVTHRSRKQ